MEKSCTSGSCSIKTKNAKCIDKKCHADTVEEGLVTLGGALECLEPDDQRVFCWTLYVHNHTGSEIESAKLCFDIRSYQNDGPFVLGPGLFAQAPPVGPTYSFETDTEAPGDVNTSYAGSGVVFTADTLPIGDSVFTLCAAFGSPLSPDLEKIIFLPSLFAVKPKDGNFYCEVKPLTAMKCIVSQPNASCLCDCNCKQQLCSAENVIGVDAIQYCIGIEICPVFCMDNSTITFTPAIAAVEFAAQTQLETEASATAVQINLDTTETVIGTMIPFNVAYEAIIDFPNLYQLKFYETNNPANAIYIPKSKIIVH